jgi:hypothetical protein
MRATRTPTDRESTEARLPQPSEQRPMIEAAQG